MKIIKIISQNPMTYLSSGHFISTEPWTHMKRISDSYEIIIGIKGTLYIKQEEEEYEVRPGEILVLLPGHLHQGYKQVDEYNEVSFYWLHFKCESNYEIIDEESAVEKISMSKNNPYYKEIEDDVLLPNFLAFKNISRINVLFKQLIDIAHSNYYTRKISDHMLTALIFEISQQTIDVLNSNHEREKSLDVSKVQQWIKINLNSKITLKDVAEEFKFNKRYFARLFKKRMGVTVNQYIVTLKLHKAKEMFIQSEMSIKEVAFLVGFEDEKYFMKLFKKYEQLTPTEFRKAYEQTFMNND